MKAIRNKLALICLAAAIILLALRLGLRPDFGEEYKYTIKCMFRYAFVPLLIFGLAFWQPVARLATRCLANIRNLHWRPASIGKPHLPPFPGKLARSGAFWLTLLAILAGCSLLAVPFLYHPGHDLSWRELCMLSGCWCAGSLLLALALGAIALKLNNMASAIIMLFAAASCIFSIAEGYFLLTSQPADGFTGGTGQSRYVLANQAQPWPQWQMTPQGLMPVRPHHPSASYAHRDLYYGKPLYDVRYTFDEANHRILPAANPDFQAELLLFGCSFTFGYGLENEETWAWKLASLLGPRWKVINYGFNGFGAHQMYAQLRDGVIPMPSAPFRQALFLALQDHTRRFSGLFGLNSPWLTLEEGKIRQLGMTDESPLRHIVYLPQKFPASQTMRELSGWLSRIVMGYRDQELLETYIAILAESTRLLREKYRTRLTVLLWLEVEYLAPRMEAKGIHVLLASSLLKQLGEKGPSVYHILPDKEFHPNAMAATEIAAGLSLYYKNLFGEYEKAGRQPDDNRQNDSHPDAHDH